MRKIWSATFLSGFLFAPPVVLADESNGGNIASQLAAYTSVAGLPSLSDAQLVRIASGEALVVVADSARDVEDVDTLGVVGIKVIHAPKLLVWLSMFDGQHEPHPRYTRATLSRDSDGSWVRYQHVNLPWPFRDRHWVIDASRNITLAGDTDGTIWEHRWRLHQEGQSLTESAYADGRITGLRRRQLARSIYLPENRGAWTLLALDADTTVVVGHVSVDLGGLLPAGLVRRYSRSQLSAGLDALAESSLVAHRLYDAEPPLYDGHGLPVSVADVRRTVDGWEARLRISQAE